MQPYAPQMMVALLLYVLKGTQLTTCAPWRICVTEQDRRRLTAADAPAGWLPLRGAARALGVSQQTILQKLKRGELEGVRARILGAVWLASYSQRSSFGTTPFGLGASVGILFGSQSRGRRGCRQ